MQWIMKSPWEREVWHRWFAWYPVVIKTYPDGADLCVWLETIERCWPTYNYEIGVVPNRFCYRTIKRKRRDKNNASGNKSVSTGVSPASYLDEEGTGV